MGEVITSKTILEDPFAVAVAHHLRPDAAADPNANTMPFIIDAVKAYATVGEITDAFRDVFGTYQEPALF